MAEIVESALREQLMERQQTVELEIARAGHAPDLDRLLADVNRAIVRSDEGRLGICETCHERIEPERVIADPLVRFCLDHLSAAEQRALERDLELAARIQRGLLPAADGHADRWDISYVYQPAGVVSGDYCDYIMTGNGDLFFMVGDVSGKGVAAAMLMSHLHATLRTLIQMELPLDQVMTRASRLFRESALPAQYATLVLGKAGPDGDVEIANAGHPSPLLVRPGQVERVDSTGLPLGMFADEEFRVSRWRLGAGETLIIFTDGIADADDESGRVYGDERLLATAARVQELELPAMVHAYVKDLAVFQAGASRQDDVTMAALRRR
jgi:phosphoserine phosphatase RsbU/P